MELLNTEHSMHKRKLANLCIYITINIIALGVYSTF